MGKGVHAVVPPRRVSRDVALRVNLTLHHQLYGARLRATQASMPRLTRRAPMPPAGRLHPAGGPRGRHPRAVAAREPAGLQRRLPRLRAPQAAALRPHARRLLAAPLLRLHLQRHLRSHHPLRLLRTPKHTTHARRTSTRTLPPAQPPLAPAPRQRHCRGLPCPRPCCNRPQRHPQARQQQRRRPQRPHSQRPASPDLHLLPRVLHAPLPGLLRVRFGGNRGCGGSWRRQLRCRCWRRSGRSVCPSARLRAPLGTL